MESSTEFRERHDDYPDERKEEIYQDFKNALAEKDPELARELNATEHRSRDDLRLQWGNRNKEARMKGQTIFKTFQESTQGLGENERKEAALDLTEIMVGHIDRNIPEIGNRGATMWRNMVQENLPAALDENNSDRYMGSMNQFDHAMKSIERGYQLDEKNMQTEREAQHRASHFYQYNVDNPNREPSKRELLELCHQEITRLNPEFGARFAAIEETPAVEQIDNWPLHDPEGAKLIYQVVHQATQEINDATSSVIAFNTMTEITESLHQQNEFNVRDRQEFNQIERQINDEKNVAARALRNASADDYLESIARMNEIQKRIAGASG